MVLGIDASNIRAGGGVVHLRELLAHAQPEQVGFDKVVVWAPSNTLVQLPVRSWLVKSPQKLLERALPFRVFWQRFVRDKLAAGSCDLLFLPGATVTRFKPYVSMCQNLLPFEPEERSRYGWSAARLRLLLLKRQQCRSFRNADGVILLGEKSERSVERTCGKIKNKRIIPHGVSEIFQYDRLPDPEQKKTVKISYVSTIDMYKHQWVVAEAIVGLLKKGYNIQMHFYGSGYGPALRKLKATIEAYPEYTNRFRIFQKVPHGKLPGIYRQSDIFVFASSCETFGIILLEAMSSGVPVACSNRSSMPEILRDSGLYFDPENAGSIANAIERYLREPVLRKEMARRAWERSKDYTWDRCAKETFEYFRDIAANRSITSKIDHR